MIDESDGDFALLASWNGGCLWTVVCLIVAAVLYFVANLNEEECSAKACPAGGTAKLLDHECVCVQAPK